MIPINLPSGNYLLIPVREGANQFEMNGNYLMTFYQNGGSATFIGKSYEIVGKGLVSECSEKDAKRVVDTDGWKDEGFVDYGNCWSQTHSLTALESLHSLIQSHNQQPDRCVLVKQL